MGSAVYSKVFCFLMSRVFKSYSLVSWWSSRVHGVHSGYERDTGHRTGFGVGSKRDTP